MSRRDSKPEEHEEAPHPASDGDYVDYVEYYDDGEWHVVTMDGSKPVLSGHGESVEAARESIFGRPDLE